MLLTKNPISATVRLASTVQLLVLRIYYAQLFLASVIINLFVSLFFLSFQLGDLQVSILMIEFVTKSVQCVACNVKGSIENEDSENKDPKT